MTILELTKQYNIFQNKVGQDPHYKMDLEIPALFSENFRKIANGTILVGERSQLNEQLKTVRQAADGWSIVVKELLACTDNLRCVTRYHLISKNLGTFDVIAILKANTMGLLEEVSEVYYQFNSE